MKSLLTTIVLLFTSIYVTPSLAAVACGKWEMSGFDNHYLEENHLVAVSIWGFPNDSTESVTTTVDQATADELAKVGDKNFCLCVNYKMIKRTVNQFVREITSIVPEATGVPRACTRN